MNSVSAVWKRVWQHHAMPMLVLTVLFGLVAGTGGFIVAALYPVMSPDQYLLLAIAIVVLSLCGSMTAVWFVLRPAQHRSFAREQRLRYMATALTDRVVMLDAAGLYYDILKSEYDTRLSAQIDARPGQRLHDIFPAAFADFCLQKVREVIDTDQAQLFEYDLDWMGERYRIEARAVPYRDPLLHQPCVIWVSRDISERKQIENRLLEGEKLLRSIFQALPDRTLIFDADGHYLEVLQAAYSIYNHPQIAFEIQAGHTIHEHFSAEFADFCLSMIRKTLDTGQMQVFNYPSPVHQPPRYFEARTIPFIEPVSGAARVLWITRDMTTAHDAAEHRHQAEEHRIALAVQQEKLEFFQQFVNNLTHDLKTPLAVIETGLYFVKRAEDASRRQMRIDTIHQQVVILNQMIDDMLTISRLDILPGLNFEDLDLVSLLQETVQQLQPRIETKHQHLTTSLAPDTVWMPAARSELRRALTNLIDNAIKYTPDQGQVDIELNADDTEIIMKVHDTGIGIEAEDIPKIFDRFYRSESGRFAASGTGLGLAIVKRIIELHGGRIEVESEPGHGSTFCVRLPVPPLPSRAS